MPVSDGAMAFLFASLTEAAPNNRGDGRVRVEPIGEAANQSHDCKHQREDDRRTAQRGFHPVGP